MDNRPALTIVPTTQTGDQVRTSEHELAELIRLHRDPLLRYALRRTFGDHPFAEDITQETLLRAWQTRDNVDWSVRDIRPWLLAVARNLIVDNYRATKCRPAEVHDERIIDRPEAQDRIADAVATHDMAAAMARLSDVHRDVLVEVYYRGRSLAEVAIKHGVPLGTVKSRMFYALRAMRPLMRESGGTRVAPVVAGRELAHTA